MGKKLAEIAKSYLVVPVGGVNLDEFTERSDLRVSDDELDDGVNALWADDDETIIAFLFRRGLFDEQQAKAWAEAVEEKGVNMSLAQRLFGHLLRLLGQFGALRSGHEPPVAASLDDESFRQITERLRAAVETYFGKGTGQHDYGQPWPWLTEVFKDFCVVEYDGDVWRFPYSFDENDDLLLGSPEQVKTEYVAAVMAALEAPLTALYARSDQTGLSDARMAVFNLALSDAPPPEDLAGADGLVWKQVLVSGTTFSPASGEPLTVDPAFIEALEASFNAGVLDNVAITADDHFFESGGIVPADKTVGFVRRLVKVGEALWAGLEVLVAEVKDKLGSLIKDVSIFAWPDFHDRRDGKQWDWVLVHLLLTNYPQLVGLAPFGTEPVAASAGRLPVGVRYYRHEEVKAMPEGNQPQPQQGQMTMTQQDAEALQAWQGLGLTVEQVQQMQQAHATTLQKARALEISAIVAALEGRGAHEAVVALDGARHYPVVVKAVEEALKSNGGEGLALDISAEGQSPLDAVVLGIVNALPLEARLVAQTPPAAPAPPATPAASDDGPPDDAAIAALDDKIGP